MTYDLDTPLIKFTGSNGSVPWTVRDAIQGTQIFGGIGSGKTSGSGALIAKKFLKAGFGGLILTAKPGEKELWTRYCSQTNRLQDLIVVEPGGQHAFDFVAYESKNKPDGRLLTSNLVHLLKTIIKAGEDKKGGRSDDAFWDAALDMLLFNVIDLCMLAYGKVTVSDMFNIALTVPKSGGTAQSQDVGTIPFYKAFIQAQENVRKQIAIFRTLLNSEEQEMLDRDEPGFRENELFDAVPDARLYYFIDQFFIETYRSVSEKTRAIVEFSFTGFLHTLMQEPIFPLFCNRRSTFTPEDCLEGKIILLNLPTKVYHKAGQSAQLLFKYIWQRAMEKRDVKVNGRPVFLFVDESQGFLHEYDADYQATARSSRIATVYLTQNLPNYYANMGGDKFEFRVKSFLGTLSTKIFHANADIETNGYASKLVGQAFAERRTETATVAGEFTAGENSAYELEDMVRPEEFMTLRSGGPENHFLVEAYVLLQGKMFSDGWPYSLVTFKQDT